MIGFESGGMANQTIFGFGVIAGGELLFLHGEDFSFLQFFLFLQWVFLQVSFQEGFVEFGEVEIGQLSELGSVEGDTGLEFWEGFDLFGFGEEVG